MRHRIPALLAIACLASGCPDADREPRARHLLFITVDTLRRDRLGCYGGKTDPSPHIDALAAEGTLFENAFTPRGMTLPSFASFFTGRYPTQHGVVDNLKQLPGDDRTLAEILAEAGFRNRAFVASGVLQPGRAGMDQGYRPGAYQYVPNEKAMTAQVERFLRDRFGRRGAREYLWVHFMNPHRPYDPPPGYADRFLDPDYAGEADGSAEFLDRVFVEQLDLSDADLNHILGLYDGTIAFVDDCVGRILAALDESGQADDTLVVFATDHGEDLYSHQRYFYHSNSIYTSTTAIALIFRQPGRVVPQRVSALVENVDFLPTVLAWLGIDEPLGATAGFDLASVLSGESAGPPRDFAVAFTGRYDIDPDTGRARGIFSARNREWHYIWNPEGRTPGFPPDGRDYVIPEEQLFHLTEDPDEQRDLRGRNPDAQAALRASIERFQARFLDRVELPDFMTVERIDELLQQGYISAGDAERMRLSIQRQRGER